MIVRHIPESHPSEDDCILDLNISDDELICIYAVIENDEMVFRPSDAGIEQLPDIDTPTRTSPFRDQLTADDDEHVGLALDDETPPKNKTQKV